MMAAAQPQQQAVNKAGQQQQVRDTSIAHSTALPDHQGGFPA